MGLLMGWPSRAQRVRGINPRDETEALPAVQMAAIHNATMAAARRLNRVRQSHSKTAA